MPVAIDSKKQEPTTPIDSFRKSMIQSVGDWHYVYGTTVLGFGRVELER